MADYFTDFSCLLDVGTPDNAAHAFDLYNRLSEDGASEDPPSDGFLLSIQPEHGGTQLWMRDDVTGDPERLIQFVKLCAEEFGLTGRWGLQYTNTSSKARVNAFGGGAHALDLASGETIAWTYTDGWLAQVLEGGDPMPEIIETTVYRLEELSDTAKDKARAWYHESGFDYDWYIAVYEDFQRIVEILGVRFKTRTAP